jgi:hypothetical protein
VGARTGNSSKTIINETNIHPGINKKTIQNQTSKTYAKIMKIIPKMDPKECQYFTKKRQKRSPEINRKTIKKLTPTPTTKRRTK